MMIQQHKVVMLGQETPKSSKGNEIRITKVGNRKSVDQVRKSVEQAETQGLPQSEEKAEPTTPGSKKSTEHNPSSHQTPESAM